MQIAFSPPDITEEEIQEVSEALRSGWITTGPRTKELERQIASYCETGQAVCLNSATACMEMALRVMGIGVGDEVITTAYTYTATCSSICHVGATPVLVDTIAGSYEMDPEQVRVAITEKTKAIIAVDLAGIVYSKYEQLYEIVKEKSPLFCPSGKRQEALGRIMIMADAAHAFGANYKGKKCGSIADFTCFSFHAVKNLTTAEGGAMTWNLPFEDETLYKELMLLSLHGQSKDALEKTKAGAWEYDVIAPYYKCNMTDVAAALGLVQLRRYPEILNRRREIIEQFNAGLQSYNVGMLDHYKGTNVSSGHLYMVNIIGKTREEVNRLIEKMGQSGIATNVHYKPLPMLTAYKNMGFSIDQYPNAYKMFESEITLPLHTCLSDEEVAYVIKSFQNVLEGKNGYA